jgi:hypothetical protein
MLCEDGACACRAVEDSCLNDSDCCDALVCIAGACRDASECVREDTACRPSASECCQGLTCRLSEFGSTTTECCVSTGNACLDSTDCCGRTECVDGECACNRMGGPCATSFDCCGLACISGTCQMTPP